MDMSAFPKYDFTFVIEQLLFEQGAMIVKYIPADTRLTSISYVVPMEPDMDLNDLKPFVSKHAPNNKWFAQEMILNNGSVLLNAGG